MRRAPGRRGAEQPPKRWSDRPASRRVGWRDDRGRLVRRPRERRGAQQPPKRWSDRPPSTRVDWRDDRGQLAGVEALPFGVLIFVVGALLITNAWAVVDAKIAADAAAREAVRSYVEAPDGETAMTASRAEAADTIAAHGRRPELATVIVHHDGDRPFARCVRVTVEVDYPVPALRLPWIGGFGHAFDVKAHHSERIDPYRSGLPGDSTC